MLEIHGINFKVEINKKKIKNIYLRLSGNTVYATCPYYVADYEVYNFIQTKREWIYKVYMVNQYRRENTYMYQGLCDFYIFGQKYNLIRKKGSKNINIINNEIYFDYPDDSEEGIKALYKFLDKQLLIKAEEFISKYESMLLDYGYNLRPILKARIMRSKWGVCYTRKNQITISSYLIHYPLDCLEYIIIHEMTHFIVPNHSKRFYEIIENRMPEYKKANAKLK